LSFQWKMSKQFQTCLNRKVSQLVQFKRHVCHVVFRFQREDSSSFLSRRPRTCIVSGITPDGLEAPVCTSSPSLSNLCFMKSLDLFGFLWISFFKDMFEFCFESIRIYPPIHYLSSSMYLSLYWIDIITYNLSLNLNFNLYFISFWSKSRTRLKSKLIQSNLMESI